MAEKNQNPVVIGVLVVIIIGALFLNIKRMTGGRRPAGRVAAPPPGYTPGPGVSPEGIAPGEISAPEVSPKPAAAGKKPKKITKPKINVELRRLTSGPNFDTQPVFSPNGREIAYVSAREDGQNIYILKFISSEEPVKLTSGNFLDESPSWSPDGSKIIFSSNRNSQESGLFWIDKFTGEITPLDKSGTNASFSPDGEWLAFADQHNIWRMKLATKEFELLTKSGYNDRPVWDKDGKKIYFVGNGSIKSFDLKISGVTPVIASGFNDYPAVSHVDNKLAYVSLESGNYDLWMINEDGSQKEQLTGDEAREHFPSWSPDGASIVFASDASGPSNLWLITLK